MKRVTDVQLFRARWLVKLAKRRGGYEASEVSELLGLLPQVLEELDERRTKERREAPQQLTLLEKENKL